MTYFYTNDHTRLYYEDSQNKQGQPMILIHGYGGSHAEFLNQQRAFEALGFRVIVLDIRNHGASARTGKGARISRLGADLADVIRELNLDHVILVGHSMGAAVIWAYLSIYGEARVAQVVTIDQSPKALNTDDWPYGLLDDSWDNLSLTARNVEHVKMTVKHLPDNVYYAIRTVQAEHPFNYEQNEPLLLNHLVQDWRDVIRTYRDLPQLFVAGGESPLWSSDYAATCQHITDDQAEVAIVPHTGHLPHVEDPETFNTILTSFVNTH